MQKSKKLIFILVQIVLAAPLLLWPAVMFGNVIIFTSSVGPGGNGYISFPFVLIAFFSTSYPLAFAAPLFVSFIKKKFILGWQLLPMLWLLLMILIWFSV